MSDDVDRSMEMSNMLKAKSEEISKLQLQVSAKDGFIVELQDTIKSLRGVVEYRGRLNDELKNKIHDLQNALKFATDFIDPASGTSPYSNQSIVVTLRKIMAEHNICDCTVGSHLKDCKFAEKRNCGGCKGSAHHCYGDCSCKQCN